MGILPYYTHTLAFDAYITGLHCTEVKRGAKNHRLKCIKKPTWEKTFFTSLPPGKGNGIGREVRNVINSFLPLPLTQLAPGLKSCLGIKQRIWEGEGLARELALGAS